MVVVMAPRLGLEEQGLARIVFRVLNPHQVTLPIQAALLRLLWMEACRVLQALADRVRNFLQVALPRLLAMAAGRPLQVLAELVPALPLRVVVALASNALQFWMLLMGTPSRSYLRLKLEPVHVAVHCLWCWHQGIGVRTDCFVHFAMSAPKAARIKRISKSSVWHLLLWLQRLYSLLYGAAQYVVQ